MKWLVDNPRKVKREREREKKVCWLVAVLKVDR